MNIQIIKSIAGSTFFKLASSVVSFVTVPILLKCLGTGDYAVWVTLTALLTWINLFDFGSGFTLKNKIAEASAKGEEINSLVAGTLQFYIIAGFLILAIFLGSLLFIQVFKDHTLLAVCIYIPVIVSFPSTLGHFMLQGKKKFNLLSCIQFAQSLIWLIMVVLYRYDILHISLLSLALSYAGIFFVINTFILIIAAKLVDFKWKTVFDFSHFISSRKSMTIGLRFFILQVSSLILYSIGNLLIYKHLSLVNVSQYDTINKIYIMGITIFNIVISVYWSEISHAKALKDKSLLFKYFKQLILLSTLFCSGFLIVSFFLPDLILWWTKGMISVDRTQVFPFMFLLFVQVFSYAGNVFLNAFEELDGQIVFSIIAAVLLIPVANIFFNAHSGISTVPISSAILTIPNLVFVLYKGYSCIKNLDKYA